ncbi:MAG: hypothetical protein ABI345_06060 [Jatrophihabitans sp.]
MLIDEFGDKHPDGLHAYAREGHAAQVLFDASDDADIPSPRRRPLEPAGPGKTLLRVDRPANLVEALATCHPLSPMAHRAVPIGPVGGTWRQYVRVGSVRLVSLAQRFLAAIWYGAEPVDTAVRVLLPRSC